MLNDDTKLELEDELDKAQKALSEAEQDAALAQAALKEAGQRANRAWDRVNAISVLLEVLPQDSNGSDIKTFGDE